MGVGVSIVLLVGLCFTGLGYVALTALERGAASYGTDYTSRASRQFADLFLFIPPRRIAEFAWVAAAVLAVLFFLFAGGVSGTVFAVVARLFLSVLLGSVMLFAPTKLVAFLRIRRRLKFENQLVDALIDMGNALKSGFSIQQAIEHLVDNGQSPISEEFGAMLHQTRVGVPFEQALRNLDERMGSEDLSLVVLSIETARRTGGNLAEIFETISRTIRERIRIRNRIDTLTAQGRLQGMVLSAMPPLIGVALYFLQPQMFRPFLHSTAGLGIMALTVLLLVCGALSIRKIVRIEI